MRNYYDLLILLIFYHLCLFSSVLIYFNYLAALSSCGIPLKSLLRVPIYTCGSSVVILTTALGGPGSSCRSLFGGGSSASGTRSMIQVIFYF